MKEHTSMIKWAVIEGGNELLIRIDRGLYQGADIYVDILYPLSIIWTGKTKRFLDRNQVDF